MSTSSFSKFVQAYSKLQSYECNKSTRMAYEDAIHISNHMHLILHSDISFFDHESYALLMETVNEWLTLYSGMSVLSGIDIPIITVDSRYRQYSKITEIIIELIRRFNDVVKIADVNPKSLVSGKLLMAIISDNYSKKQQRPISIQEFHKLPTPSAAYTVNPVMSYMNVLSR